MAITLQIGDNIVDNMPKMVITDQEAYERAEADLWDRIGILCVLWVAGFVGAAVYWWLTGLVWGFVLVGLAALVLMWAMRQVAINLRLARIARQAAWPQEEEADADV